MSKEIILIKLLIAFIAQYYTIVNALPQRNYIRTIALEPICTDNETGRKLLVGETINRIDKCTRIQCIGDENIWQYECNIPNLNGNCEPINGLKPHGKYPDCCPQYLCVKKLSEGNYVEKTVYDQYANLIKKEITQFIEITSFSRSNYTVLQNEVVL